MSSLIEERILLLTLPLPLAITAEPILTTMRLYELKLYIYSS